MRRKPKVLHNFYKSDAWKLARQIKMKQADGKCERCGSVGEEVHHKIRLTVDNVKDVTISINPKNLELLCKDCHNKEHDRFIKKQHFDRDGNLISSS
jgi:5-methylcytosine-specific restriction endonuclease McrA